MKPSTVKIIQIIAKESHILGLGDDGMVYLWIPDSLSWEVWGDNM